MVKRLLLAKAQTASPALPMKELPPDGPIGFEQVIRICPMGPAMISAMEGAGDSTRTVLDHLGPASGSHWMITLQNRALTLIVENIPARDVKRPVYRLDLKGELLVLGAFVQDFVYYLGYLPWQLDARDIEAVDLPTVPDAVYAEWEELFIQPLLTIQNLINHGMNMGLDMETPMATLQTAMVAFVEGDIGKFLAFQKRAEMEALSRGAREAQDRALKMIRETRHAAEADWMEEFRRRIESWRSWGFDTTELESGISAGSYDINALSEYEVDVNRWRHEWRRYEMLGGPDSLDIKMDLGRPWHPSRWPELKRELDSAERTQYLARWTNGARPEDHRNPTVTSLLSDGIGILEGRTQHQPGPNKREVPKEE